MWMMSKNNKTEVCDWNFGLYLSSYFSIVTETEFNYVDGEDIPSVNFSEKTLKILWDGSVLRSIPTQERLWSLRTWV